MVLRALAFCEGDTLTMDALPSALRISAEQAATDDDAQTMALPGAVHTWKEARGLVVDALERAYLEDLMQRSNGKLSEAARIAQIDRRTIQRMLQKHEMDDLLE